MNKHRDPSQGRAGRDGRKRRDADLVLLFLVALIGAVVIWGLFRDRIDTAALLALSSLAGAVAGLSGRSGGGKKPEDDKDE